MPWKDKTVEETRKEFVERAQKQDLAFCKLCQEYGICRATGYKWLRRYEEDQNLSDLSRRPLFIANKTDIRVEQLIVDLRKKHPGWGARKLKTVLENQGVSVPCEKTVNNILNRYHCISKEESLKRKPYQRFEKSLCNEMWQTDFKGEFKMQNGVYCYPLDIIDDHSRYVLKLVPKTGTANTVIPTFREAFFEYGMPRSVLSDNGPQFGGFRQGITQFEKWLMNHDVLPIHGRARHPQTQGKIERFHRSMKDELLKHRVPTDIEDAALLLAEWIDTYNHIRPHEALNMRCPAELYVPSDRKYNDAVEPFVYSGDFRVIKVNKWGYVRFGEWQVYLSESMIGEYVEFRPNPHGDSFVVCYRNFILAEYDALSGNRIHRSISRL